MDQTIDTSFLVISDTHADDMVAEKLLSLEQEVDVAIHCGDLTDESKLDGYRSALRLLKGVKAQLKLVIAGNHDFAMDDDSFKRQIEEHAGRETRNKVPVEVVQADLDRNYGARGEAKAMFEGAEAKAAGIVFLNEGTRHFTLANGADLHVYASPYTCSESADWGFQYKPEEEHSWNIPNGIDIAITHSPPRGVLDRIAKKRRNNKNVRAGSDSLFTAVAQSKPKMHCFGHIHESWGAKMVTWRKDVPEDEALSHFNAINNGESTTLNSIGALQAAGQGYPATCNIELDSLEAGRQTLFVNAALEELEENRPQPAFIVNIPLTEAKSRVEPAIEIAQSHANKRASDEYEQETTSPAKRTGWR